MTRAVENETVSRVSCACMLYAGWTVKHIAQLQEELVFSFAGQWSQLFRSTLQLCYVHAQDTSLSFRAIPMMPPQLRCCRAEITCRMRACLTVRYDPKRSLNPSELREKVLAEIFASTGMQLSSTSHGTKPFSAQLCNHDALSPILKSEMQETREER